MELQIQDIWQVIRIETNKAPHMLYSVLPGYLELSLLSSHLISAQLSSDL